MGTQNVRTDMDSAELRRFTKKLLRDMRAFEVLLQNDAFETGVSRIGAEQEMFLVDHRWRPASVSTAVLESLDEPHFTTELALFNMECNLDPLPLEGDSLRRMERQLNDLLTRAREAAIQHEVRVVLTGILPTLTKADLSLENMTPNPRYFALNESISRQRGEDYQFRIRGRDELIVTHDNVMLEACNTSFQVHFQVDPSHFARRYNIAQAVAAPVLAAATNSPLLFGRRLWRETRIALFQQSIDTRAPQAHIRDQAARVSFGQNWVRKSALEIFKEDVARFRVLFGTEIEEDPFEAIDAGRPPALRALRLHNSTVYRWNRPCYGVSHGKPHLRIENRILPSGPTPLDEMANAAFWFGLMRGVWERYDDITQVMDFGTAKENFVAAARLGLAAQFGWPGREQVPAGELIRTELLPLAREGLQATGIDAADAERYLGVIEERVAASRTGAQWMLDSFNAMRDNGTQSERLAALVAAMHDRQTRPDLPVHRWKRARLNEAGGWKEHYRRVGQLMTTDLFTVQEDELVDLVAHLMQWKHIRHVPVEDAQHRLVGLVTHRSLLRLFQDGLAFKSSEPVPVSRIMQRDVITATPRMSTLQAIQLMRDHGIACLPVVNDDNRLVGIITERDFMGIAGDLFEKFLADSGETNAP
jgi:CBS domain-containing protein/gamma-glutamyl:cysteine ligase YbdK (ATP-grasp superfamily)